MDPRKIRTSTRIWQSIADAPASPGAEAIRSLKLTLDLKNPSGSTKIIGLTSCLPSEGKTTIAAAVAANIAQSGKRVLLVDGDLRNPTLSRSLAPDAEVGLLQVIDGKARLPDAIWSDPSSRLEFLPNVGDPAGFSRADMFATDGARLFFEAAQMRYDHVIVDLPPMVAGVDVRATLRHISAYVLVVEWGATKVDQVEYALRNTPGLKENIAGVVLNKVDIASMSLYDAYGARYYYYGRPPHSVN